MTLSAYFINMCEMRLTNKTGRPDGGAQIVSSENRWLQADTGVKSPAARLAIRPAWRLSIRAGNRRFEHFAATAGANCADFRFLGGGSDRRHCETQKLALIDFDSLCHGVILRADQ